MAEENLSPAISVIGEATELTVDSPVGDDEVVFRSIQIGKNHMSVKDGKCRASSQAFADRSQECSVDRAALLEGDHRKAKLNSSDHIAVLNVEEIRQVKVIKHIEEDGKETIKQDLLADVLPRRDPKGLRIAHAVVALTPDRGNKSNYRKLCEKLAFLAVWVEGSPNPCN